MLQNELQEKIAELLFQVYKNIPWKKFKVQSPRDVFNHRVRSASRKQNLETFISKLCNYFGMQQVPTDVVPIIRELKTEEERVLEMLYQEHIYLCALAFLKYDEYRKNKKSLFGGEQ